MCSSVNCVFINHEKVLNYLGSDYMDFNCWNDESLEIIKGAYDLHVHTSPSHFQRLLDDFELCKEADKVGMKGILIKSHYETTYARAKIANKYSASKVRLYGGVALNWPVGGINPFAAESGLNLGAKIVWMPTRDSHNSLSYGNMEGDFFERPGISIYDENMEIKDSVYEVLEIVRKYKAFVATGHLSIDESIHLCKEARKMKVNIILTHPDWIRTLMPLETQIDLAKLGVIIEKVGANIDENTITVENMALAINKIGSENILMVTDRGQADKESPIQAMIKFISSMLSQGIKKEDIKNMIHHVPEDILGLR